jgi:predicted ATP-grasp superfamily ATP-dependent carboligase
VGLSIHGLAVARALARRGIVVHCLSDIEASLQPTVYTRYAKVHFRRGLNTGPLRQFLLEIAAEIGSSERIVLFPTSDRISKAIGQSWDELSGQYALSWAHCRDLVLELQRKDSLAQFCERAKVAHPKSTAINQASDCESVGEILNFPIVIKPAQPLSSFKAIRVATLTELRERVAEYRTDLPFVAQEWIDGLEPSLYSCTSFLDHGKPLYLFTSRKLAASPPGTGQGTVFETVESADVLEISDRFMRSLDLSGPVAVEFKRDVAGCLWLIEPNVGRTEYCVDLAIQSGFDLPYVEYLHTIGESVAGSLPTKTRDAVWFDTDKDLACFLANMKALRRTDGKRRLAVFPFVGHDDFKPAIAAFLRLITGPVGGIARRVGRTLLPARV